MRRLGWLPLLLALGCGSGSRTFLVVTIEAGSPAPTMPITSLRATLTLQGQAPQPIGPLSPKGAAVFALPTSLSFELVKGEGRGTVEVFAQAAGGADIAHGSTQFDIGRGETGRIIVTLGRDVELPDAGVADAKPVFDGTLPLDGALALDGTLAPDAAVTPDAAVAVDAAHDSAIDAPMPDAAVATLSLMGSSFDFGSPTINTSTQTMFAVANNSSLTTGALAVTLSGVDAAQFSLPSGNCAGTSLAPSTNCTIVVAYHPTGNGAYRRQAMVNITAPTTQGQSLAVSGIAALFNLTPPGNYDFGIVPVGTDRDVTFTVHAIQSIGAVQLQSSNPVFSFPSNSCPSGMMAGEMCTFVLRFHPTAVPATGGNMNVISDGYVSIIVMGQGT